jgi:hypothetical protein
MTCRASACCRCRIDKSDKRTHGARSFFVVFVLLFPRSSLRLFLFSSCNPPTTILSSPLLASSSRCFGESTKFCAIDLKSLSDEITRLTLASLDSSLKTCRRQIGESFLCRTTNRYALLQQLPSTAPYTCLNAFAGKIVMHDEINIGSQHSRSTRRMASRRDFPRKKL